MNKKKYSNPNISISKVYTKKGDSGKTSLIGGSQVNKDDLRVCAYGEIDELNALIGACKQSSDDLELQTDDFKRLKRTLLRIQNELFNLGNVLATPHDSIYDSMPQIEADHVLSLENDIDFFNKNLPTLKSFVLPGGSSLNIWFHLGRTVCRRCERVGISVNEKFSGLDIRVLEYLNRLSDYFFVLSRWVGKICKIQETLWSPNNISSLCEL